MENARTMGKKLMARLREMEQHYDIIGEVRGKGLMIGVEFVSDDKRTAAPLISKAVLEHCFKNGIALLPCGKSTIRLCPPLVVNEEECDIALDVFEKAVRLHEQMFGS
jgi:4-aminobutyrate aminotransferase